MNADPRVLELVKKHGCFFYPKQMIAVGKYVPDLGFIDNEEYEDELNYIAKQLEGSL